MELNDFIKTLPKYNWVKEFEKNPHSIKSISISKSQIENLFDSLISNIAKENIGLALNFISLIILVDKNKFFINAKKKGFLRVTNYIHGKNISSELCSFILQWKNFFQLNVNEELFVKSFLNISKLHKDLQLERMKIQRLISSNIPIITKTLVAYLDDKFVNSNDDQLDRMEDFNSDVITHYTVEELGDAVSYLISIIYDEYEITDNYLIEMNEQLIFDNTIDKLVISAVKIREVMENEIRVENFNFICEDTGDVLKIVPDEMLEKSYRYGIIRNSSQRNHDQWEHKEEILSCKYREQSIEFQKKVKNDIVHKMENLPFLRYAPAFPEDFLQKITEYINANYEFTMEEQLYIREVFRHQFIGPDIIKDYQVVENITLYDLVLFKRIIKFLYGAYFKSLAEITKGNRQVYLISTIPFLKDTTIKKMFGYLIEKEKIEKILELLCYEFNPKGKFDIQYQPILSAGNSYLFPANIIICSNLIRNCMAKTQKQIMLGNSDPMLEEAKHLLTNLGFRVEANFSFNYKKHGLHGDIDLIAIKDHQVFIFECKYFLFGVDAFEVRSNFEKLTSAAEQLNKILKLFSKDDIISDLKIRLKIDRIGTDNVHTCVLSPNRLFTGSVIKNQPVRNLFELATFLSEGAIGIVEPGQDEYNISKYALWKNEKFDVQDLINYINPENILYKIAFDAMLLYSKKYKFKNNVLEVESYGLNLNKHTDGIKSNFREIKEKKDLA